MSTGANPFSDSAAQQSEPVNLASDYIFTGRCRGLYVGTAGTIIGRLIGDTVDITYTNVAAGVQPLAFTSIKSTANGTTASGLIGLL